MGDLRERMRQAMVGLGWPEGTRETYLWWGYDLAKHYKRSPELLSGDEVQRYVFDHWGNSGPPTRPVAGGPGGHNIECPI